MELLVVGLFVVGVMFGVAGTCLFVALIDLHEHVEE
jgi:hypothetical protein